MKLFPGLLIASFMGGATIFAQTPVEETNAVLQTERDGCAAYLNGDAEKIANFLTEDYTLTNSKGEISARALMISPMRRREKFATPNLRITI
jgi:hypothetical protein